MGSEKWPNLKKTAKVVFLTVQINVFTFKQQFESPLLWRFAMPQDFVTILCTRSYLITPEILYILTEV